MPSLKMTIKEASPKPVRFKLARRFYEAIKLEEALAEALKKVPSYAGKVSPETETFMDHGDKEAFLSLLNKLAHVCDIKRGGETVAAVVPILEFDCIRYFLASNGRKSSENVELETFFRGLLGTPLDIPPDSRITKTKEFLGVLRGIADFNEPRIAFYTRTLGKKLSDSLSKLGDRQSDDQQALERTKEVLQHAQSLIESGMDADEETSALSRVELIRYLQQNGRRGPVAGMISRLCDETAHNPESDWSSIRHLISRLRAYHVSTETIIASKLRWPELFEKVEITVVPSSKSAENPLGAKHSSLHVAIGRITSDRLKLAKLREQVMWLDRFGLKETFQEVCSSQAFKPWVHAEVGAHEAVRKYLDNNPGFRFWRNIRYIGSSKPTCRLCHYYFREVGDGIAVRDTHGNLYPKWRLPDCFDEEDEKRREDLLNAIIKYTRQDTVRVIQEKVPRGSANDSTSNPTVPLRLQHRGPGTVSSLADITEALENVSLLEQGKALALANADDNGLVLSSRVNSVQVVKQLHAMEDRDVNDEREDGGVSLL